MKLAWQGATLAVHHGPMALFLAWDDDSGDLWYMNSEKLEWFWSRLEFVGTQRVATCATPGAAADAMWTHVAQIEAGAVAVTADRVSGERDFRRWTGETWDDPLEAGDGDPSADYQRWQHRRRALASLSIEEVAALVASIGEQ